MRLKDRGLGAGAAEGAEDAASHLSIAFRRAMFGVRVLELIYPRVTGDVFLPDAIHA